MDFGLLQFAFLRESLLVAFLLICSYYDIFNKKNIPLWVTIGMVAAGVLLNLATLDTNFILYSSMIAIIILAIGYAIYKTGQIGGADVFAFMGIALLIPSSAPNPAAIQLLQYPFVFSVFLVSGFLAMLGICAKYIPRIAILFAKGKIKPGLWDALASGILVVVSAPLILNMFERGILSLTQATGLSLLIALTAFLSLFKSQISDSMIEWVKLKEIDEEDVIALKLLDPKTVKRYKLNAVLEKGEFEKLKRMNLKKYPIYKGMPAFMPYLLLAAIIILAIGDPILLLF